MRTRPTHRGRRVPPRLRRGLPIGQTGHRVRRLAALAVLLPITVVAAGPPAAPALRPAFGSATTSPAYQQQRPIASRTRLPAHGPTAVAVAGEGIPPTALRAYRAAEATMRVADPRCRLSWSLLAGIGAVETDHGRAASARGPLRLLPSVWAVAGVDGDGDGTRDPHDIDDATLAAAAYLCAVGGELSRPATMRSALLRYNPHPAYAVGVTALAAAYERSVAALPFGPAHGVGVGVGDPGRGVLIGLSDSMTTPSADARRARDRTHRRARRPDRHRPRPSGTAARGPHVNASPRTDRPRGRPGPTGARPDRRPAKDGPAGRRGRPDDRSTKPPGRQPDDATGRKTGGKTGGGKTGGDRQDEAAAPAEYHGMVTACGDGYCLDDYVLEGEPAFADHLGQTVTVVAVLQAGTLLVSEIVT